MRAYAVPSREREARRRRHAPVDAGETTAGDDGDGRGRHASLTGVRNEKAPWFATEDLPLREICAVGRRVGVPGAGRRRGRWRRSHREEARAGGRGSRDRSGDGEAAPQGRGSAAASPAGRSPAEVRPAPLPVGRGPARIVGERRPGGRFGRRRPGRGQAPVGDRPSTRAGRAGGGAGTAREEGGPADDETRSGGWVSRPRRQSGSGPCGRAASGLTRRAALPRGYPWCRAKSETTGALCRIARSPGTTRVLGKPTASLGNGVPETAVPEHFSRLPRAHRGHAGIPGRQRRPLSGCPFWRLRTFWLPDSDCGTVSRGGILASDSDGGTVSRGGGILASDSDGGTVSGRDVLPSGSGQVSGTRGSRRQRLTCTGPGSSPGPIPGAGLRPRLPRRRLPSQPGLRPRHTPDGRSSDRAGSPLPAPRRRPPPHRPRRSRAGRWSGSPQWRNSVAGPRRRRSTGRTRDAPPTPQGWRLATGPEGRDDGRGTPGHLGQPSARRRPGVRRPGRGRTGRRRRQRARHTRVVPTATRDTGRPRAPQATAASAMSARARSTAGDGAPIMPRGGSRCPRHEPEETMTDPRAVARRGPAVGHPRGAGQRVCRSGTARGTLSPVAWTVGLGRHLIFTDGSSTKRPVQVAGPARRPHLDVGWEHSSVPDELAVAANFGSGRMASPSERPDHLPVGRWNWRAVLCGRRRPISRCPGFVSATRTHRRLSPGGRVLSGDGRDVTAADLVPRPPSGSRGWARAGGIPWSRRALTGPVPEFTSNRRSPSSCPICAGSTRCTTSPGTTIRRSPSSSSGPPLPGGTASGILAAHRRRPTERLGSSTAPMTSRRCHSAVAAKVGPRL